MAAGDRKTILLVEDEAVIAMAEKLQLERGGYSVVLAHNATDGIAAASNPDIDLILMDIDLGPGMDGTEAAQAILHGREFPIVFLTGHAEKEVVERVKGITRYGYVLKDSGTFVLLETIEMALQLFESQRSMAAAERRYRTLFETAEVPITIFDENATVVELNRGIRRAIVNKREEIIGRPLGDFVPELHDETVRRVRTCIGTQERAEHVDRVQGSDGRFYWYRSCYVPLPTELDDKPLVQAMSYDITNLVELQRRVESGAGESFADAITEVAPLMMYVYDHQQQRNIWANRSYLEMVRTLSGETASALPREGVFALFHPEDLKKIIEREKKWKSGDRPAADDTEIRMGKEGEWRWFLHRSAILEKTSDGKARKIIGFLVDIDAQKKAQTILRESAERQELLRREMSHRIKNNLAMIRGLVSLKMSETGWDLSDLDQRIGVVSLLHELLISGQASREVDLREYTSRILAAVFGGATEIQAAVHNTLPEIRLPGDRAELVGLIVNEAATNALKHAFSPGLDCSFSVALEPSAPEEALVISLTNTGKPFPVDTINFEDPETMGLKIIRLLGGQLAGTAELVAGRESTKILLKLPKPAGET